MSRAISLEEENKELRRMLTIMRQKAYHNDQLLHSFFEAKLKLMSSTTLAELVSYLLNDFRRDFKLSSLTLMLLDPEDIVRDLLQGYEVNSTESELHLLKSQSPLNELFPDLTYFCGEPNETVRTFCFPHTASIQSCVLLPLIQDNCLIGSLNLGSHDQLRYSQFLSYDYVMYLASVLSTCIEICISRETLVRLSSIDSLTTTANRRSFNEHLSREINRCQRSSEPFVCMMLDIDHFKSINDRFGHLSGDQVLRAVAQLLKEKRRILDCVARYGGEEFALLLPSCSLDTGLRIAEELRRTISQTPFYGQEGESIQVTCSIGLTVCDPKHPQYYRDVEKLKSNLISSADQALYRSKHNGRNSVHHQPCPMLISP